MNKKEKGEIEGEWERETDEKERGKGDKSERVIWIRNKKGKLRENGRGMRKLEAEGRENERRRWMRKRREREREFLSEGDG